MIRPVVEKSLTASELILERLAMIALLDKLNPTDEQDRAEIKFLQAAIESIEEVLAR